jgi:hypothetical protein
VKQYTHIANQNVQNNNETALIPDLDHESPPISRVDNPFSTFMVPLKANVS